MSASPKFQYCLNYYWNSGYIQTDLQRIQNNQSIFYNSITIISKLTLEHIDEFFL